MDTQTDHGNTIDDLIGILTAYKETYGGDMLVTASYGTDEARTDYELNDMFAIDANAESISGGYGMHYAADGEKPVLDILL